MAVERGASAHPAARLLPHTAGAGLPHHSDGGDAAGGERDAGARPGGQESRGAGGVPHAARPARKAGRGAQAAAGVRAADAVKKAC
ncbi:MAG TPA: hypothetical protein DIT13_04330 [Verrucomicrobiales bacterium]|nr:hypothetical protein [Verrucomicrobiales bacterium]